jgi:signal transduction histidine kinase
LSSYYPAFYQQVLLFSFGAHYLVVAISFLICGILPFVAYYRKRSREYLLFMISYLYYAFFITIAILGSIGIRFMIYDKLNAEFLTFSLMVEITIFTIAVFIRIYSYNEERKRLALEVAQTELKAAQAKLEGQNIERKRISRDLHDNVGAQLTNIAYSLNILEYKTQHKKSEDLSESINDLGEQVQNTTNLLRDTIWAINSESLSLQNFQQKINEYLSNYIQEHHQLEYEVEVNGDRSFLLTSSQALHLFRIIQEALQNTVKYAQANLFKIKIEVTTDILNIMISDDGQGFEMGQVTSDEHYGLINMQERANELNADFKIKTAIGRGFLIKLSLKL